MKFVHEDLSSTGDMWYIVLEIGSRWYCNSNITPFLKDYSNFTYEEIALKFGAFIEDESGEDEYFFEEESDCIRCKNFLNELIR